MNNIWTVYYIKDSEVELSMNFIHEEDAVRFRDEALYYGYSAYYLRESVYSNFDEWMTKYLAK